MAARHCPSWADFQPELLGLVLGRLPLADRVRLAAVCRPWRRVARQEPLPPPLPWLTLLDGTFLSIPGGEIHRMPAVPDDACCYGSIGNWLFLKRSSCEFSLVNPFSEDVVRLPYQPGRPIFVKPVLLSTLDDLSPDSPFAIFTTDSQFEAEISICRAGAATTFRVPRGDGKLIYDVAFFDGKLYALSFSKLFVLDLGTGGSSHKGTMKRIADAVDNPGFICQSIAGKMHVCAYWNYLVESSGKLLHVRRLIGYLSTLPKKERMENSRTLSFEVFEADLSANTTNSRDKWRRVHALGGQALFVGTHSKSLPASECGAWEDCIYFVCDYDHDNCGADPLRDCGVFNMRNGMITPLLPDTVVVRQHGCNGRPAFFFPTKTM